MEKGQLSRARLWWRRGAPERRIGGGAVSGFGRPRWQVKQVTFTSLKSVTSNILAVDAGRTMRQHLAGDQFLVLRVRSEIEGRQRLALFADMAVRAAHAERLRKELHVGEQVRPADILRENLQILVWRHGEGGGCGLGCGRRLRRRLPRRANRPAAMARTGAAQAHVIPSLSEAHQRTPARRSVECGHPHDGRNSSAV